MEDEDDAEAIVVDVVGRVLTSETLTGFRAGDVGRVGSAPEQAVRTSAADERALGLKQKRWSSVSETFEHSITKNQTIQIC